MERNIFITFHWIARILSNDGKQKVCFVTYNKRKHFVPFCGLNSTIWQDHTSEKPKSYREDVTNVHSR